MFNTFREPDGTNGRKKSRNVKVMAKKTLNHKCMTMWFDGFGLEV